MRVIQMLLVVIVEPVASDIELPSQSSKSVRALRDLAEDNSQTD